MLKPEQQIHTGCGPRVNASVRRGAADRNAEEMGASGHCGGIHNSPPINVMARRRSVAEPPHSENHRRHR